MFCFLPFSSSLHTSRQLCLPAAPCNGDPFLQEGIKKRRGRDGRREARREESVEGREGRGREDVPA